MMVKQYSLLVDLNSCYGCYACEVACKQENNLPVGLRWIRVATVGSGAVDKELSLTYVPIRCMHCGRPPCIEACPEGAIKKRPDGIVVINEELCIGCKKCIEACPFAAVEFDPEKGIVEMCNMCLERIEKGQKPACVEACLSGCIYFGETNEIIELIQQRHLKAWYSGY